MKQVLVKGGNVQIEEVPPPCATRGTVLVRVSHSLISSGTESGFVSNGGTASFLLQKAKDPLNIEKVKQKLASVGVKGTIDVVKSKLFQYQSPGYSTSGVIVECGAEVPGLRVGDRFACSGVGYASHAEYNNVPHQLVTPIPDGVDFDEAAFVTLGAIALQGIRRAEPTLGETFVVVGLGPIGQLTAQLARATGCRVVGCDPIAAKRQLADTLGIDATCAPEELSDTVAEWTGGYGADAVLVCAASTKSAITNEALDLCRQKGRTVVVGAVGLDLQREPLYLKELDFKLSCSYGPGRYNPYYEEKGLDYPIGYVRWTEGRNMAEFLRLIAEKKVQVKPLISVTKPIGEAAGAYSAILDNNKQSIAALITYGPVSDATDAPKHVLKLKGGTKSMGLGVAVIGAGAFAKAHHLPNLGQIQDVSLEAVVAQNGASAKQTGERFGARYCATDYHDVLKDDKVHAVVIATRHHLHAEMAIAAAEAGKHIFLEKPLALTVDDGEAVCAAVEKAGVLLTVGFNRRFSAYAQQCKAALPKMHGPKTILYRCNAGPLPKNHWAVDPDEGGGRILGEAVHFYDFCCWLLDATPTCIQGARADNHAHPDQPEDDVTALLRFADGSLATVVYCTTGHPAIPKERIEIFGGTGGIVLDDFRGIQFAGIPGKNLHGRTEDKGQRGILQNFVDAVQGKAALGVTAEDGLRATRIACEALERARG